MPSFDCVGIRMQVALSPGSALGFVLYRLTYTDDAQWKCFMDHLNKRTRLNLEDEGEGDLFQHVDWEVQEDPDLQDADDDEVRRYHVLPFDSRVQLTLTWPTEDSRDILKSMVDLCLASVNSPVSLSGNSM